MIKLYPRAWRQRYGAELEELVRSQPSSVQLFVDLLGGAIDARFRPQALARRMNCVRAEGGNDMLTRLTGCCERRNMTEQEARLGAALSIGSALVVATMLLVFEGPAKIVAWSLVPGVLVVGMQPRYLRGHSTLVKVLMTGGMFLVLLIIGLLAAFLM